MAKNWDEKEVFSHALGLPAEEREAYLNQACPDEASRARIESLLRHRGLGGEGFLVDALAPKPPDTTSPARIGEFRIIRRLGEGGMGVVYLAEDTTLNRQVAVKVLHPHLTGSEQALARFREEARSAAKLKHPAIVTVFNFSRDGGTHFIVSEFVDGPTLAEEIAARRAANLEDTSESRRSWHRHAAETIATIADALDCAHRANLVHRDVKPSNILMDRQVGPRLTDFGIAKHLTEEDRTRTATVVGSCHYMSPEQASIAGAHVDQRSDVFSLGVVLYELLALRRPFEGVDTSQVLKAVIECAPPRLRGVDPRIPKDLETICHMTIEREPVRRYQTAAHVAADLRCYLAGAPILARPASVFRRTWRWVGRHRAAAMVLTTLVLCGVVAALGWTLHHRTTEALAWFTVQATEADCTVFIQHVASSTLELGESVLLGSTPIEPQSVPPGAFRVTVVKSDETAFVEFNVLLDSAGRDHTTTLLVTNDWTEPDKKSAPGDKGKSGNRILRARLLPTNSLLESGMGYVPSGEFPYGWSDLDVASVRKRTVFVSACHVDYTETPNRDYKQFCDATGHPLPAHWKNSGYESVSPDAPVVGVTWEDAEAYARWVGKRLPSMFEWQAAARGREGRRYPLGDDAIPVDPKVLTLDDLRGFQSPDRDALYDAVRRFAVSVADGPADVNGFRQFAGNAREISGTVSAEDDSVVVMGRCWTDSAKDIDLTKVVTSPVSAFSMVHGFRCAKSSVPCRSVGPTTKKGSPNAELQSR